MSDEFWRKVLDGISGDMPTDGAGPPKDEEIQKKPLRDGESPVTLQKIITEVYIYTSTNDKDLWFGSQTLQDVQVLGAMRLADAHKVIETARKKRRRGR
jgi:hypothetical protein